MKKVSHTILDHIKDRVLVQNKNFMGCITGPTGSGKSFAALKVCQTLDPDFSIDNCTFTAKQFMSLLNSDKLKKGSAILGDELGIMLSSRRWQNTENRLINYVLQSFRHRNLICLFTVPSFDFIDVQARKLIHAVFMTQYINKHDRTCHLKPFFLQINQQSGKTYYKYLKYVTDGRWIASINDLSVGLPTQNMIDAYEVKKKEYLLELGRSIERDLAQLDAKDVAKKTLTDKQQEVFDMVKSGIGIPNVSKRLKINVQAVYQHLKLAKAKGFRV